MSTGVGTAGERERTARTPDPRQERSQEWCVRIRYGNIHNQLRQTDKNCYHLQSDGVFFLGIDGMKKIIPSLSVQDISQTV